MLGQDSPGRRSEPRPASYGPEAVGDRPGTPGARRQRASRSGRAVGAVARHLRGRGGVQAGFSDSLASWWSRGSKTRACLARDDHAGFRHRSNCQLRSTSAASKPSNIRSGPACDDPSSSLNHSSNSRQTTSAGVRGVRNDHEVERPSNSAPESIRNGRSLPAGLHAAMSRAPRNASRRREIAPLAESPGDPGQRDQRQESPDDDARHRADTRGRRLSSRSTRTPVRLPAARQRLRKALGTSADNHLNAPEDRRLACPCKRLVPGASRSPRGRGRHLLEPHPVR